MNLVKASSILYPILGENVADIVLSYMKPKKRKAIINKPNMRKFFIDNDLWLYKINDACRLFKAYPPDIECCKSLLEDRDCKDHPIRCQRHEDFKEDCDVIAIIAMPEWVGYSETRLIDRITTIVVQKNIGINLYKAYYEDTLLEMKN